MGVWSSIASTPAGPMSPYSRKECIGCGNQFHPSVKDQAMCTQCMIRPHRKVVVVDVPRMLQVELEVNSSESPEGSEVTEKIL